MFAYFPVDERKYLHFRHTGQGDSPNETVVRMKKHFSPGKVEKLIYYYAFNVQLSIH